MFSKLLNSLLNVVEVLLGLGVSLISLGLQLLQVYFCFIHALLGMLKGEHYLIELRVCLPNDSISLPGLVIKDPLQFSIYLVPLIAVLIIDDLDLCPDAYGVCAHLLDLILNLQLLPLQPLNLSILLLPL